jgi:SulP family sulfate permease
MQFQWEAGQGMQSKDVVSGLVTAIVVIATTLSYSALIFSGPLAGDLPVGIAFGLMSAGLTAIGFALFATLPFSIAGPDSKPVTVLASLGAVAAADLTRRGHPGAVGATVYLALVVGSVATGAALFLFGTLRFGRWIRYIPYPVLGGFLAASGWLLVDGSARVLTGVAITWETLGELVDERHRWQLAAGIGFAVIVFLIRQVKHFLAFPALLLAGSVATHFALQAAGYSLADAQSAGWLLGIRSGANLHFPWAPATLATVEWGALLRATGEYVALIAVTASTLMLGTTAIEVATRNDVDVDRELRVNGLTSLVVGLCGGMVGTLSVSRTMLNYAMGARHRSGGIVAGALCLLTLLFGTSLLGYIPVPILGGMLLRLGAAMLGEWLILGWRRMPATDYAQVIVILLVIMRWDFVAGIGVGVIAACVTFAINSSRIRLVKLGLTRSDYGSRVERAPHLHDQLVRLGKAIQIMWLHGFLFFGSANRLVNHIKEIVTAPGGTACRMVILDFHEVLGIDSSSVLSLIKLRQFAERENFVIVVSGLPPVIERTLRAGGFLPTADDPLCRIFPDIDAALEWCEDRLLAENAGRGEAVRSADEWLSREIGSLALFARLVSYLELMEFAPGQKLFDQGDTADSLYLIYVGRVTILYRPPDGHVIRLRSMAHHTVVGEMGLYRSAPRGAEVMVDEPTVVYRLTREAMLQMEEDDPSLAYAFHKFVIRTIAARLDFANREIAGLQQH